MPQKTIAMTRFANRRRGNSRQTRRGGYAAVELALCVPFLITVGFGAIETCNVIHLRTRMYSAAYDAVRLATRPTTSQKVAATSAEVTSRATTLLTQLGVANATVTLQPTDLSAATAQTPVTVTISAPLSKNSLTTYVLTGTQNMTVQATLIME